MNHGLRARAVIWPPLRLARMRCERGSVVAVLPASSREIDDHEEADHADCGIEHPPRLRRGGDAGEWHGPTSRRDAGQEASEGQVCLIAEARIKTDVIDATVLGRLYASGFLPEVWTPDEATLGLRRQVTRRIQIVRQCARLKTIVQLILHAHLVPPCPHASLPPARPVIGREANHVLVADAGWQNHPVAEQPARPSASSAATSRALHHAKPNHRQIPAAGDASRRSESTARR